jgi:dolichol-phosphate mannosyltransferase
MTGSLHEPLQKERSIRSQVLVVLPTYNERANLQRVISGIRASGYEVAVVDDSSPDGTGDLADEMAKADSGLHVLHRPSKMGLGSAKILAFKYGLERRYDAMTEMDADASHLPEFLDPLVEAARRTGGVAIGSRYVPGGSVVGWGPARRALSGAANIVCRQVLGLKLRDCTSGYRCYSAATLSRVGLDRVSAQGYGYQVEMLYRCRQLGVPITEIPIRFVDRVYGNSKVTFGEVVRTLVTVFRLRFARD